MAEEEKKEEPADKEAEGGVDGAETKPKSKKKLILIAVGIIVFVGITVGALFFLGVIGGGKSAEEIEAEKKAAAEKKAKEAEKENKSVYFNMKDFIVNLNKVGGQASFLKMSITLEIVGEKNVAEVKEKVPVIRDSFQVYLRELRADDLQGSSGIYRLREGLLLRVNKIVYPIKINDILFREILIQ